MVSSSATDNICVVLVYLFWICNNHCESGNLWYVKSIKTTHLRIHRNLSDIKEYEAEKLMPAIIFADS